MIWIRNIYPLLFESLLPSRYTFRHYSPFITFCYNVPMSKLIVFNWKENPRTAREAERIFAAVKNTAKRAKDNEVVVCPPLVYLGSFSPSLRGKILSLGAQNVFWENGGAYTGEISADMLKQFGVRYVIIGHSERRRFLGETDEMVNKKVRAALAAGLRVILCVGEPSAVRNKGVAAAKRYIKNQLTKDLQNIVNCSPTGASAKAGKLKIENLVVAYEPIWAIGTGKNATADDAREMAIFIKDTIRSAYSLLSRVLYGGSVSGKNAADYINCTEIDGVLVGGASLKADEVGKIISNI
jgi:triosephosphate isomerase